MLVALMAAALVLLPTDDARADTLTGDSTTGTASTVSPSTIAVGGTLSYTLSGFPEGAHVAILIDDADVGPGGQTGVVGELTVGEDGTYAGAVELPTYVAKGAHWLRFKVTAGEDIPTNAVRTLDYTNKSPYFTVADVTIIGGEAPTVLSAPAPTGSVTPSATPTPTATPAAAVAAGAAGGTSTSGTGWASASLPVVTTVLLALAAVLAVLTVIVLIERRRLLAYEHELEYATRR
ncbi:DNA-directed RNA polymerase II [Actinomyces ruminis]|uniref:DNA-directed RNA polymerase II n=2 Tax=Actinomyces ruminis TaxID=1937003 RepID=A0ABX4M9H2_9ACTO|nr:DNA-directed RNA polymerase II [Actinomyces ruminis]